MAHLLQSPEACVCLNAGLLLLVVQVSEPPSSNLPPLTLQQNHQYKVQALLLQSPEAAIA